MKLHAKQFKSLKLLISVAISSVFMLSSFTLSASNDFWDLADAVISQTERADARTRSKRTNRSKATRPDSQRSERSFEQKNYRTQNNLIDTEKSRSRSGAESERLKIRVSLDQAVNMIRRSASGKVIKAKTSYRNGRPVHEIRVLSENKRIRTYRVDAVTGRRL